MPSAVIHMAVANEVNKKIKRNYDKFMIGAIAPDIAKQIGLPRSTSHFSFDDPSGIPKIDKFLEKYHDDLDDDFVMGYFVHLYTDYLWGKYFIPEIYDESMIKKLDGSSFNCSERTALIYIYNDYTNLNIQLFDEYDMDLHIFYNELPRFDSIIKEIPMDRLNVLMDAMSLIIENTKTHKDYVFDINNIKRFISISTDLINAKIEEILS